MKHDNLAAIREAAKATERIKEDLERNNIGIIQREDTCTDWHGNN